MLRSPHAWLIEHAAGFRRLAIVAACLMTAVVVGRLMFHVRFPLFVGGAIGAAVLIVCAFRPHWGVLLLLFVTLFVRSGFATGEGSPLTLSLVLTGALAAAWILRMLVEEKRIRLLPSPVNWPLLAFAGIAVASTLWSNLARDPFVVVWDSFPKAQLGSLATMVLSPAAALLAANHLETARQHRAFVAIFAAAAGIGLVGAYGPIDLPFPNTGGLFALWTITLLAGQALFNESLSRRVRIGIGLAAFAWFAYWFSEGITWKSGWIPPLIALFVLTGLRSRKALIGLAIIAAIFGLLNRDYLAAIFAEEEQISGVTRLAAWEQNWTITRDHLLLGTGPAGYAVYYMTYFPQLAMATHSNYIDVVSQLGLMGLLALVWLLVSVGGAGWGALRRVPRGGFEHGLAASLLSGFVGLVIAMSMGDWFLPFAYTQGIAGYDYTVWSWMMIGVIMRLHYRYSQLQTPS